MNNVSIIKDLFEIYSKDIQNNTKLLIALIVFISINLIVTFINIYAQIKLKNKEKKIYSFNLKEKRRIETSEELFKMLDELTFFDGKNTNDSFLTKIQTLERYVSSNKLYISKDVQSIVQDYNDYFKSVLTDYRTKDYAKEIEFTKCFCNIFNS